MTPSSKNSSVNHATAVSASLDDAPSTDKKRKRDAAPSSKNSSVNHATAVSASLDDAPSADKKRKMDAEWLEEVETLQKSKDELFIPKKLFKELVMEITEDLGYDNMIYSHEALGELHVAAESYLVDFFGDRGHQTLKDRDMKLDDADDEKDSDAEREIESKKSTPANVATDEGGTSVTTPN